MARIKGMDGACSLVINESGNFDLITPDGEVIKRVIDVDIEQEMDFARNGVAIATIRLYVNPENAE